MHGPNQDRARRAAQVTQGPRVSRTSVCPASVVQKSISLASRGTFMRRTWNRSAVEGTADYLGIAGYFRVCAGFWTPATTRRSAGLTGRRPKSAKARSRGKCARASKPMATRWEMEERRHAKMATIITPAFANHLMAAAEEPPTSLHRQRAHHDRRHQGSAARH
jgi:hypothetical protein